jgi:hypothetical protein
MFRQVTSHWAMSRTNSTQSSSRLGVNLFLVNFVLLYYTAVINCQVMFDPTEQMSSVHIEEASLSSSRTTVSLAMPSRTSRAYSSASIKRSLLHDQHHYRVQYNSSTRASAQCWKVFGFPSRMNDENANEFIVIPGFASCKRCCETYKYIDSSTGNLNSHQCSRALPSDQHSLASFVQSPS